jgi:hypothetical protein
MAPNQAVSARRQAKINARRDQRPKLKDVPGIIVSKTVSRGGAVIHLGAGIDPSPYVADRN